MDYLIACYGLKGDLSPVMLKKIFHESFENLEITRICMEKQCNRFFRNIRLKVLGLPNCCGATEGSEQQHNQDLKEIYKARRILEFITFYYNALHLTTLFTARHCI